MNAFMHSVLQTSAQLKEQIVQCGTKGDKETRRERERERERERQVEKYRESLCACVCVCVK